MPSLIATPVKVVTPSPYLRLVEDERPIFELHKSIPPGIAPQIEKAVEDFIRTSHLPDGINQRAFYYQTLQSIANASVLGQGGDLWLGINDGELWIYILANMAQNLDDRLSYIVTQAWVRKDQRGKAWVKWAWEQVRQRAKNCLCGHLTIISTRNPKAYERFLGHGLKQYAVLMKEELTD